MVISLKLWRYIHNFINFTRLKLPSILQLCPSALVLLYNTLRKYQRVYMEDISDTQFDT